MGQREVLLDSFWQLQHLSIHDSDNGLLSPYDAQQIKLKQYINCQTANVSYALSCSFLKVYVGQTSQKLKKRIQQHLSMVTLSQRDSTRGKTLTSVLSHILLCQGGKCKGVHTLERYYH